MWTNDLCACHVHVSLGPNANSGFGRKDLVNIAKGAYFWEEALKGLLPYARRGNRYAVPNYVCYGEKEYKNVLKASWKPLFTHMSAPMEADVKSHKGNFIHALNGESTGAAVKYMSTNFQSYLRIKTVEFRRQAGIASATSAIYRVLLALTLNVSALEYNYPSSWRGYEPTEELIAELVRCMQHLPERCEHPSFRGWMRQCAVDYAMESEFHTAFSVAQVNAQERDRRIAEKTESTPPPPQDDAKNNVKARPSSTQVGGQASLPVRSGPGQQTGPFPSAQTGSGRQGGLASAAQNPPRPSSSAQTGQGRQTGAAPAAQGAPRPASSTPTGQRRQTGSTSTAQNLPRPSSSHR